MDRTTFNYELKDLNSIIFGSEGITQKQLKVIADKALKGHLIVREGIPEIPCINGVVDWNYNTPILPDTAQLLLQSLTPLIFLSKAYEFFKQDGYLELAVTLFYGWYRYLGDEDLSKSNSYVWNDHAVALRTEYLIYFLLLCFREGKISNDMYTKIYEILIRQGEWLNDEQNYFPNCNHGIFEDYSLICLAELWETESSVQWLANAKRRLLSQKQFAFTEEMVHVENSPGYHLTVVSLFERIALFLKKFGDADGEELYQGIEKSKDFLKWMVKPTGYFADIGDTDSEGAIRPDYKDYLAQFCKDTDYTHEAFKIYPQSGYYFSRSSCGTEALDEKAWFMFKAGYQSRVHKHADDLSFMLTAKGYDIFVDAGSYGNMIGDPTVDYLHSALAHNTVAVDEKTYSISNERTHLAGICEYSLEGEIRYVRGFNDGYQNVYIDRAVYQYGDTIFIHDEIQSPECHVYSQLFHLPGHINVIEQSNEEVIGEIAETEYVVLIRQLAGVDGLYRYSGQQENKRYGYRSPCIGKTVDCTTLRFEKWGGNSDFVTMINIVKKKELGSDSVFFFPTDMTIGIKNGSCIRLKRRERPKLDQIKCEVNKKTAQISLADHSGYAAKSYQWELWDAKWGKLIRSQNTTIPSCVFKKDFYVDAYVRVVIDTGQNQIKRRIVAFLKYQPDAKRHKVIEEQKDFFNLDLKGLLMEWTSLDTVKFTIVFNYDLKAKINWHIYRNGGHYDYIFKVDEYSLLYRFTEPGNYTAIFSIEGIEGEKQFWNYPQIEFND